MSTSPLDPKGFDAITFDCYGTLIDWETGILEAARPFFATRRLPQPDHETVLAAFARLEPLAQAPPFRSYREVLMDVARGFSKDFGFRPEEGEVSRFAASVGKWPPFPDTVDALKALSERYRLAIVSNVDDDLFAASAVRLEVRFDEVVTAQQVQAYKPGQSHFVEAVARLGLPRERVLHAAQSLFHDIAPAGALGITTAWINRRAESGGGGGATAPSDAEPDHEFRDMASLAAALGC